jgi:HD-GYP domain-containing protein (c-di-GMP phosphodiesterase class II)
MLLQSVTSEELRAPGEDAERAGDWNDALAEYEAALRTVTAKGDFLRASVLMRAVGRLHFERGSYDRAAESFQNSLKQAERVGDVGQTAAALNCLGVVEQYAGHIEAAEGFYRQAAQLSDRSGDSRLAAMVLQNLATLSAIQGDFDAALEANQRALDAFGALGDDAACARVLNNIGKLQVDTRQLGHAELTFRSALTLAERAGNEALRIRIQAGRAELALARNDYSAAHEFCNEAFQAYTKLGSVTGLSETYRLYGVLYRDTQQSQLAGAHFMLALRLAQSCGDLLLEAEAERERAALEMQEGRHREALAALNNALRLFQSLRAQREVEDIGQRLERVERVYLRVVEMLETEISISFDAAAVEQYQRVSRWAARLAAEAGFSGHDLTWLRIGAFLYDIGKRSVPPKVLNKRGPLNAEEWQVVQLHVVESEQVVRELDAPWDLVPMVRHHHEHWDGTGYPDRLSGADIPVAARILCIADAFTALTSHRSFRKRLSDAEALVVMENEAGKTFDPELFQRFRALVQA